MLAVVLGLLALFFGSCYGYLLKLTEKYPRAFAAYEARVLAFWGAAVAPRRAFAPRALVAEGAGVCAGRTALQRGRRRGDDGAHRGRGGGRAGRGDGDGGRARGWGPAGQRQRAQQRAPGGRRRRTASVARANAAGLRAARRCCSSFRSGGCDTRQVGEVDAVETDTGQPDCTTCGACRQQSAWQAASASRCACCSGTSSAGCRSQRSCGTSSAPTRARPAAQHALCSSVM